LATELGRNLTKDIFNKINQQKKRGRTHILSMESTNKREEARPKSSQRNQPAREKVGHKTFQRN
jgi:hypothetical protein